MPKPLMCFGRAWKVDGGCFMASRRGDPSDWDFTSLDKGAAFAGTAGPGEVLSLFVENGSVAIYTTCGRYIYTEDANGVGRIDPA